MTRVDGEMRQQQQQQQQSSIRVLYQSWLYGPTGNESAPIQLAQC